MNTKIKKCKYCKSIDNLYTYPNGEILNVCIYHFKQYNLDRYAKRKEKLKNKTQKEYDEKICQYCGSTNLVLNKNGIKLSFCENCKDEHYKARNEKSKKTLVERLGVEHPAQSPIILKKMGDTMEKNYGKRNASQIEEFQNKKIKTSQKNWGTDYPLQSEILIPNRVNNWTQLYGKNGKKYNEYHEKVKNTTIEVLGVENASQSEIIKEKKRNTTKSHLGVEYPAQSIVIQDKIKQTNLENLGVEYIFQSPIIKEKSKQTNLENLRVEYPMQSKEIQEKSKLTSLENWGTEYPMQSPTIKNKIFKTNKNNYWDIFLLKLKNKYIITLFDKEYYINNDKNFKFKCLKCNNEFISNETNPQRITCHTCDKSKSTLNMKLKIG